MFYGPERNVGFLQIKIVYRIEYMNIKKSMTGDFEKKKKKKYFCYFFNNIIFDY